MVQNQLLCYKMSYCLGVSDNVLVERYYGVHLLASRIKYFDSKKDTRTLRALNRVYFLLIRHCDLYRKVRSIYDISGNRLDPYLEDLDLDIDSLFRFTTLLECVNKLATMVNNLVANVYKELEVGLTFSEFTLLTWLPQLSEQQLNQIRFLLQRTSTQFNIYFYSSPVLNANVIETLRSDLNLLKRLILITGPRYQKVEDNSVLAQAVRKEDDDAFLHFQDFLRFNQIFVDTSTVSEEVVAMVLQLPPEDVSYTFVASREEFFSKVTEDCSPGDTLLITHCDETVLNEMGDIMDLTSILLTMPLPRQTYRRVVKHEWPNTYLLSMKNSNLVQNSNADV